jgi:hypothetical protein
MKLKLFERLFTKNLTRIPLLFVDLNYNKYKSDGAKGSCMARVHPNLANDKYIYETLNDLIDYIRDNYDMDKI